MSLSPLLFLLLGGLALIALGAWTVVKGRGDSAAADAFVRDAVVTEADVTDLRLKVDHRVNDRDAFFFPVVRFTLPDGRVVEAETMLGAKPAPTRVGRRVPVRYDPADPSRVVLAEGRARAGSVGCARVGLGLALVAVGLFVCLFWVLLAVVLEVPV
jgi:hypothetical protein